MDGPSLPRSIRWRLQLGLLALPNSNGDEKEQDNVYSFKELYECNASLLQDQRRRYQDLVEQHAETLHAFLHAEQQDDNTNANKQASQESTPANETTTAAVSLDPLTAMLREQEAQEKRRQELELKYRKERARRNRGISNDGQVSNDSGGDGATTDAVRQTSCVMCMMLLYIVMIHVSLSFVLLQVTSISRGY